MRLSCILITIAVFWDWDQHDSLLAFPLSAAGTAGAAASAPRRGSVTQVLERARVEKNANVAFRVIENKIKSVAGSFKTTSPTSTTSTTAATVGNKSSKKIAAVAYRETRLLKIIAIENKQTEGLADFWVRTIDNHPFLATHSTALFELLDAHILAGNITGLLYWSSVSVSRGGRLTPPLLKELLFSYAYNTTSSGGLPMLLPILSRLCNSNDKTKTPPLSAPSPSSWTEALGSDPNPDMGKQGRAGEVDARGGAPVAGAAMGTFLWLPLPMSLLRRIAVDLLAQSRSADALAVLSCVHPLQWPYDALLTSLASERPSRIKDCASILRQRQDLVTKGGSVRSRVGKWSRSDAVFKSVPDALGVMRDGTSTGAAALEVADVGASSKTTPAPTLLSPIRGSTARALLAMGVQQQRAGARGAVEGVQDDVQSRDGSDVEAMRSIRSLVAKAVAQTSSDSDRYRDEGKGGGHMDDESDELSADRPSVNSAMITEDDVKSGLVALLKLYNLTFADRYVTVPDDDAAAVSAFGAEQDQDAGRIDRGDVAVGGWTPEGVSVIGGDNESNNGIGIGMGIAAAFPLSASGKVDQSKWADPESPENLAKFLADVESLGAGKAGNPGKESSTAFPGLEFGLRVSGSKKSWKQNRSFGVHYDKTGYSPSFPVTSAGVRSNSLLAESAVLDVDQLVCNALADSLLDLSRDILLREVAPAPATTPGGPEDTDIFSGMSALGLLPSYSTSRRSAAAPESARTTSQLSSKKRQLVPAAVLAEYRGAVEALYAGGGGSAGAGTLHNRQAQSDRLFDTYPHVDELSQRILKVAASRKDAVSAAAVVEQMAYRGYFNDILTSDRHSKTFKLVFEVMISCCRGNGNGSGVGAGNGVGGASAVQGKGDKTDNSDKNGKGDRGDKGQLEGAATWRGMSRIFSALRPNLMYALVVAQQQQMQEGESTQQQGEKTQQGGSDTIATASIPGSTSTTPTSTSTPTLAFSPDDLARVVRMVELGAISAIRELEVGNCAADTSAPLSASPPADADANEAEGGGSSSDELSEPQPSQQVSDSGRTTALELVQALISLGIPLKSDFGSELILSFLRIDDVDSALGLVHMLLQGDQHVSDHECQLLASRLVEMDKADVALALCRLTHSRGKVYHPAFYTFLFERMFESASVRGAGFGLYLDGGLEASGDVDTTAGATTSTSVSTTLHPPAVEAALGLLREIEQIRAPSTNNVPVSKKEVVVSIAIALIEVLRSHGLEGYSKDVSRICQSPTGKLFGNHRYSKK